MISYILRTVCSASLTLALISTGGSTAFAQDAWSATEKNEEINLSVGENHTLNADNVKSYSEGAQGIVKVHLTPDGKKFIVVAKSPGTTTLLLLKKDGTQQQYRINVARFAMASAQRDLSLLLENTPGLRVRRVGNRLFIEGGVSTESELQRVERIASLYPDQVESLVVLGGPSADRKQNIVLDVYFLQVERGRGYQFGVSWPNALGPARGNATMQLLPEGSTRATAQVVNQPLLGLDMAATRGWAKVLKHSTLITANGAHAEFSSGGEQNYRLVGGLDARIEKLTFGITMNVLPRFDSSTRQFEVQVTADVSDLVPPTGPGADLPGRNTTTLNTTVTLKLGQGLMLSGIETYSERHSVSGVPWLSEIPLLGVFFGSHQNQEQETEGAIYMIPQVVEAIPLESQRLLDDLMNTYDDFSGKMPRGLPHRAQK